MLLSTFRFPSGVLLSLLFHLSATWRIALQPFSPQLSTDSSLLYYIWKNSTYCIYLICTLDFHWCGVFECLSHSHFFASDMWTFWMAYLGTVPFTPDHLCFQWSPYQWLMDLLKGTVSREKLLNWGLEEMDWTLTIDRTWVLHIPDQLFK